MARAGFLVRAMLGLRAQERTGVSASLVSAVAYLESWGDPNTPPSPTGPKGIMQIAAGTAKSMGLRMVYATRYRTVAEQRTVKGKRVEIQGDQVARIRAVLEAEGFEVAGVM